MLALLAVIGGGVGLYRYIRSLPTPEYVTVSVVDPPPTKLEKDAKPEPLKIAFSAAAAPLDKIGKDVTEGFTVTPPVAGKWHWDSDTQLVFTPAGEWPVGQDYHLDLNPGFTARQALLASRRIDFHSPRIDASVVSEDFWEDPTDPKNKRAVVAIKFTHPVDKATLEKRIAIRMRVDPEERFDGPGSKPLQFKLTFDDVGAKAFVQSEPIAVPERPGAVEVTVAPGVQATRGGTGTASPVSAHVSIPGVETYFSVRVVQPSVVTNAEHRMERVATIQLSAPVRAAELGKSVSVWELPKDRPATGDRPEVKDWVWRNPAEVTPEVLAHARRVEPAWLPSDPEWSKEPSFRFEATGGRFLYVRIEKGARSFGDYALVRPFTAVFKVEPFPRAVEIMHEGAVLALSGGRKLSVLARNLHAIDIELARLLPGSIAHLASQSTGKFQSPSFYGGLGIDNLAEVFHEVRTLADVAPGEPQYEAVDVGALLSNGAPPRGLFQLRVTGWDPATRKPLEVSDRRIVLVTDLGFVVKDGFDGTHDVFVMSFATGAPVAGADVQLIGRNGLPVLSRVTDADGHAQLPKTEGLEREKTPTAYVVQKGGDLAFLPVGRYDRRLDFSRFDTGGVTDERAQDSLQAFLFSDRGVYRPGETATLGLIVKPLDWSALPDGLPLELVVADPRSREIRDETIQIPRDGFRDYRFPTTETSLTGIYQVALYTVRDGRRWGTIGEGSFRVEEFLPDRMTIDARLSAPTSAGWIAPAALRGRVALRNLIGTPAIGNRVKGTLRLSPAVPSFPRWAGWSFFDPASAKQSYDETLAELKTDDAGTAEFDLHLDRFERATYRLRFIAEGFEAEGNRSVSNDASAIVSPLPYLVAWKADGDLDYVKLGTTRAVSLVAVGPDLAPLAASDVSAELIEITYPRVLTRQESGLMAYQSVKKETSLGTRPVAFGAAPSALPLPTGKPGRFVFVLRDAAGTELNRISFEVVGEGNVAGRIERNAELKVKLAKTDYAPGEDVEVAIVAPYAGAGLITIERDEVYASTWFKSDGNATVQHIRVPETLEGNGYVVVSFVRDLASRDVYLSPLSSGAAPFSVSRARRTQQLTLQLPEKVLPGSTLHLGWTAGEPTKLAVLAVDEGILQVARWRTPDPLSQFFRKRALSVATFQILDLLLPEYDVVRALAAPGGDQDTLLSGNLNPFKRKGQPPAAFWSGVLDVPAGTGGVDWQVPDVFNGTLRVVAVAVNGRAIGVADGKVVARGPFVVQPTIPYFVAPGDEFDATALVTNVLEGSGAQAAVQVALETSSGLEVTGPAEQSLTIAEGRDASARWHVRVTGHPGTARGTFRATAGAHVASATLELSIRPASPYLTTFTTRVAPGGRDAEITLDRSLFSELRDVTASASTSPLGLVQGLVAYLRKYPHGCSEQVTSAALPGVLLGARGDLGFDAEQTRALFERARDTLQARQNGDGEFGLWDADGHTDDFVTAWATHFLIEARARGQAVPESTIRRALDHFSNVERARFSDLSALRALAYGLYLQTRTGQVRTNEARLLRESLERVHAKGDLASAFLAAVFQQLNLDDEARALLDGVAVDRKVAPDYRQYYDPLMEHGLVLYLLAKHFPARARALPADAIAGLAADLPKANTLSAAALVLGLDAYTQVVPPVDAAGVGIVAVRRDGGTQPLALTGTTVLRGPVPEDAVRLRYGGPGGAPLFDQLVQAGFDREPPAERAANGLEVSREIRAADGAAVTHTSIASKLDVVLFVRATDGTARDVALVDLLPGGFEVDLSSSDLASRRSLGGGSDAWSPDHVDVREDRVVLYGLADKDARRFVYRIKPTNRGRYRVPPVLVEGFYDRTAWGRGLGGEIDVGD